MNANTNKFADFMKSPVGKKLWAIGGCLAALLLAQVMSPASTPSAAPTLGMGAVRMLVVLAGVCGLAWWLLKKLSRVGDGAGLEPALKVVSKTNLGPRNGLALVEADGIRVLVAYGDGFARVLPLDPVAATKENAS